MTSSWMPPLFLKTAEQFLSPADYRFRIERDPDPNQIGPDPYSTLPDVKF